MNRTELIKSAQKLKQVDGKFTAEFSSKRDLLIDTMNKKMAARKDVNEMVGRNNIEMMKDNHANHARFLESIFYQHSPETLVDTIIWVFRAYRSRNFSSTYWAAQLNTWIEIYRKELSSECFTAIYPYYNWMQINIPVFNKLAEENPEAPNSAH
jgi:tRNA isopentenyl-2-thiomethyl-A-37 hydroxylase MiaE